MTAASLDRERLLQAVALAHDAIGVSDPNPRVGCVIGRDDGSVLGRGATQAAGQPHAEIMAMRAAAAAAGHDSVRGATAWVTLEPCAHHGRTPPCCDALVAAGIARCVVAVGDPNPLVNGQGIARLRAAGIAVQMAPDDIAAAARELNIGFFSRLARGVPWVRVKMAASIDGRSALPNGVSRWITSDAARADGHAWRRRASAVLTGIGTVLADDPQLDVRHVPTLLQPLRVVADSRWRTPPAAQVLAPPGRTLFVGARADGARQQQLHDRGAETLVLGDAAGSAVDLPALLRELAQQRGCNELHVEAGAALNGALLRAGLVDELLLYLAPRLLGPGRAVADIGPFQAVDDAVAFDWFDVQAIGADLRLRARPPGRADF